MSDAKSCTRGCGALVYFDKNSPTGHPSPDRWIPLEMKGNLRTDMAHNCPKRNGHSSGTLDASAPTLDSLTLAQGLVAILNDYIRLKKKEEAL